jgi:hypothetical protein
MIATMPMTQFRVPRIRFALLGSFLLLACGIDKVAQQAVAKSIAVGTILATPPVEISAQALAQEIPGLASDAGFRFDGGLRLDAGVTIPGQSAVTLFFGQRQGEGISLEPTGVAGAEVKLVQTFGPTYTLSDNGGGNYSLPSEQFRYADNGSYEFRIVSSGQTFVADVKGVPQLESIDAFHPESGYLTLTAKQPFTFTRPEPVNGGNRKPAFVTVFPIESKTRGAPTYTNVPSTPFEILKFAIAPSSFATAMVTVPASAFPEAGKVYAVVLQSIQLGKPQSVNLFTASTIVAGTGDVAIIRTKP